MHKLFEHFMPGIQGVMQLGKKSAVDIIGEEEKIMLLKKFLCVFLVHKKNSSVWPAALPPLKPIPVEPKIMWRVHGNFIQGYRNFFEWIYLGL